MDHNYKIPIRYHRDSYNANVTGWFKFQNWIQLFAYACLDEVDWKIVKTVKLYVGDHWFKLDIQV